jgi:hypothetical protein
MCSLRKEPERVGREHFIYAQTFSGLEEMYSAQIKMVQEDEYDRHDEEEIAACVMIYLMALASGIEVKWTSLRFRVPEIHVSKCPSLST